MRPRPPGFRFAALRGSLVIAMGVTAGFFSGPTSGSSSGFFSMLSSPARAEERVRVGEEILILADGPGKDIRGDPHLARGKDSYMAVWREGWNGEGGVARIYAARIDDQGRPLDPGGIEVAPARDGFQELPRVAFGGRVFLVVWQDFRNGRDFDVLGMRISPEGMPLDSQPITIGTGPRTQSAPDVVSDGRGFLVAWQTVRGEHNTYRIEAVPIAADGRIGAPLEIASPWTKAGASVKLAWDGSQYRAAFVSESLLSARLKAEGSSVGLAESEPIVTLRGNLGAAIGFSHSLAAAPGKGVLAVFARSQPDYWGWGGPGAMICCLIGTDGKADPSIPRDDYPQKRLANWLDFGSDKAEGSPWPHGQSAVTWDGKRFVAVWQRHHIRKTVNFSNSDLIASRVDGWRPLDETGVPVAATELEERSPALASDGAGNCLCFYEKHAADGRMALVARAIATR